MKTLNFTGERVVPGGTPANIFKEHEQRYNFAAQFVQGEVVLDIACGSGMGSEFLRQSGANKVIGVDIDSQSLAFASERYPGIEFISGDAAARIPLPDASVDVVVSFETIEHLRDQDTFLAESLRVLRQGGKFICSSPNHDVSKWLPASGFHVKELRAIEFVELMQRYFSNVGTDVGTTGTFAQREVQYPKWVARALARMVTERLGIKPILKRVLNIQPEPPAQSDHFVEGPDGMARYTRRQFRRPMFLIHVGQKFK